MCVGVERVPLDVGELDYEHREKDPDDLDQYPDVGVVERVQDDRDRDGSADELQHGNESVSPASRTFV